MCIDSQSTATFHTLPGVRLPAFTLTEASFPFTHGKFSFPSPGALHWFSSSSFFPPDHTRARVNSARAQDIITNNLTGLAAAIVC